MKFGLCKELSSGSLKETKQNRNFTVMLRNKIEQSNENVMVL